MAIIPATSSKILTKYATFANHILIVCNYYNIPKLYAIENITTEEVMDRIDIFQERYGKVDYFGWWDIKIIQTNPGMQFTSKEFQEGLYVRGVRLSLAAPYHQEMNVQV